MQSEGVADLMVEGVMVHVVADPHASCGEEEAIGDWDADTVAAVAVVVAADVAQVVAVGEDKDLVRKVAGSDELAVQLVMRYY